MGRQKEAPKLAVMTKFALPSMDELRKKIKPPMDESKVGNLIRFPHNDMGNADRFVLMYGENLRYCAKWGKWLRWSGTHWTDGDNQAFQSAKAMVAELRKQAHVLPGDAFTFNGEAEEAAQKTPKEKLLIHVSRSGNARSIEDMLKIARTHPRIAVVPDQFDRDPYLLNCLNGTVDLNTYTLRPPERADMITKLCRVRFDRRATCPRWLKALDEMFPGDKAMANYLQRVFGQALTGQTQKEIYYFTGGGDNGKTLLLSVLHEILGETTDGGNGYAHKANIEILLQKPGQSTNDQLYMKADLQGVRFLYASEFPEEGRIQEALLKDLTGDGKITGRKPHGGRFTFNVTHTLFIDTNPDPKISGQDDAIWNRTKLIRFPTQFFDKDIAKPGQPVKDPGLKKYLLDHELPGILMWAVKGWRGVQLWGVGEHPKVRAATASYRAEMDYIADFLDERCDLSDPEARLKIGKLYQDFREHSERQGQPRQHIASSIIFGKGVKAKGYVQNKSREWVGIQLRERSLDEVVTDKLAGMTR
jgi:putative DNA primase/helicase